MQSIRVPLAATLTLALGTLMYAQTASPASRLRVELTAGPSLPLGTFADAGPGPTLSATDPLSNTVYVRHDEAGFARRGLAIALGVRYRVAPALALGAEVAHTRHATDVSGLQRFAASIPVVRDNYRTAEHAPYLVAWLGASLRYRFAILRRLALEAGPEGGWARAGYPDWGFILRSADGTFVGGYAPLVPGASVEEVWQNVNGPYDDGLHVGGAYFGAAVRAGYDTERFGIGLTARLRHARFSYDVFPSAYPGNSNPPKFYQDQLRVTTLDIGVSVSCLLLKPRASRPEADAGARAGKR